MLAGVGHGFAHRAGEGGDLLAGRLPAELADDEPDARVERARLGRDVLELGHELCAGRLAGVQPAAQVARGAAREVCDLVRREAGAEAVPAMNSRI